MAIPTATPTWTTPPPAPVSPVGGLLWAARISARQFLTGPRKWMLLLIGAVFPALMALFVFVAKDAMIHPFLQLFDQLYLQGLMLFIALIGAVPAFSSDVEDQTVLYLFARPTPRPLLVAGKWLGMIVPLVALACVPVLLAWPFATAQRQPYTVTVWEPVKSDAKQPSGTPPGTEIHEIRPREIQKESQRSEAKTDDLVMALAAAALGVLQYGTLFFALGVIFARPYIISLCYAVIFEIIIGRTDARIHVISKLVRSATIRMLDPTPGYWKHFLTEVAPSPFLTGLGLIVVPAVSMGLAGAICLRKTYVTKGL